MQYNKLGQEISAKPFGPNKASKQRFLDNYSKAIIALFLALHELLSSLAISDSGVS